jgi:hypothetical protein
LRPYGLMELLPGICATEHVPFWTMNNSHSCFALSKKDLSGETI